MPPAPTSNFIFDVVVSHFEAPNEKINDPKLLTIEVSFNRTAIPVTSSRINVSEFKTNAGTEFVVEPKRLRSTLAKCGLPVVAKYDGNVIGSGLISFPSMVTDRIEEGMEDIMHVDSCKLDRGGEVIGKVEILCRLIIKCDNPPKAGASECSRNMDKSINPQDILFIMGESQHCPSPCDPCVDALEAEDGDERLNLDLQRYQSMNERVGKSLELKHNPAANEACCELKKMALEYEQLIDSITKGTGQLPPPRRPFQNTETTNLFEDPSFMQDSGFTEMGNETTIPCFSYMPGQGGDDKRIGDAVNADIKPIRFCPVCLTNMSWLPKFAACPKCGVKPTPVIEDRLKDKKLTADQILAEYLGKPLGTTDDYCVDPCAKAAKEKAGGDSEDQCRCTCKAGKICAHCRIRKLCADIFQSEKKEKPKMEPKSSEDFCVVDNSNQKDCRPYLARVFSELRDLYDIKDTKKKPSEFDVKCDQLLTRKKEAKADKKAKESGAEQQNVTKKAEKTSAKTTCKPSQQSASKGHGTKIGHKFCVNRQGAVARQHGWAWTTSKEARRYGWQPGAIRKPIKNLMKFFLQYAPVENESKKCEEEQKEKERQMPILNVSKKNGEIFITLRALNSPANTPPLVFKVVKSDMAVAMRQIKRQLKDMGFDKCTCHRPVMLCVCRHNSEKKLLESKLRKMCASRGLATCVDKLVLTDTSDSELEFDFDVTPPAGVKAQPQLPMSRTVNHGTQTQKKDQKVIPQYPVKFSPYYRAYDCAVGDRYTGTQYGEPGEVVFEDGAFGYFGGGPHGSPLCGGARPKPTLIWGAGPGGPMRGGGRVGSTFRPTNVKGFPGGGKTGPYGEKGKPGTSKFIPVNMPARFFKGAIEAAKAEAAAKKLAEEKRRNGINMLKYIEAHGGFKPKVVVGPDGLTDAQRRRRELLQQTPGLLCQVTRKARGGDPCAPVCYDNCGMPYDPRFIC